MTGNIRATIKKKKQTEKPICYWGETAKVSSNYTFPLISFPLYMQMRSHGLILEDDSMLYIY